MQRKQGVRQRWRWLAFGIISGLVLLAVVILPREKRLLVQATSVVKGDAWKGVISYDWLSDHELLVTRRQDAPDEDGDNFPADLYRYDIRTGNQDPLVRLNALLDRLHGNGKLSPDGQWLLGERIKEAHLSHDEPGTLQNWIAVKLDGSRYLQWPVTSYDTEIVWMSDSRHWIEFVTNQKRADYVQDVRKYKFTRAFIHSVDSPRNNQEYSVALRGPLNTPGLNEARIVAVTPERIISDTWNWRRTVPPHIDVIEAGLTQKAGPSHRYMISIPRYTTLEAMVYSPKSDRIAWEIEAARAPLLKSWLHRLFPAIKAGAQPRVELWTSRLNGTDFREVGHITGELDVNGYPRPTDIQWLPDGKHLSFSYQDALWTVPVD